DVGTLLGGTPQPDAKPLAVILAAGQRRAAAAQPPIQRDGEGLRVNVIAGAQATARAACVPACTAPDCAPPPVTASNPVEFDLEATFLGLNSYMVGVSASET